MLSCLALAHEFSLDHFETKCTQYLYDHVSELAAKLHSNESVEAAAAELASLGAGELAALVTTLVRVAGATHAQLAQTNRQLAYTEAQLSGMTSDRDAVQAKCHAESKLVSGYKAALNQLVKGFDKADSLRNKIHCHARAFAK